MYLIGRGGTMTIVLSAGENSQREAKIATKGTSQTITITGYVKNVTKTFGMHSNGSLLTMNPEFLGSNRVVSTDRYSRQLRSRVLSARPERSIQTSVAQQVVRVVARSSPLPASGKP